MRLLHLERHALGPRVHVLGVRVHEWHLGIAGLLAAGLTIALGAGPVPALLLAAVSAWLVVKDWRDLHPATRDTASWARGIHRLPGLETPRGDAIPAIAAVATAGVGLLNLASAVTPSLPERLRALVTLASMQEVELAHALAVPTGIALLGVSWHLWRRRRGALLAALVLLALLAALDILKGLDVEEASITALLAAWLWRARPAFHVGHAGPRAAWSPLRAGAVTLSIGAAAGIAQALGGTVAGLGVLVGGGVIALAAWVFAPPVIAAGCTDRERAARAVRAHGDDTLSAFKLRADLSRRWSPDGRAFAAYRIEAGTLILAGDPVGPAASAAALLDELAAEARRHGLRFGVCGAGEAAAQAAHDRGLHRMYMGDEAIVSAGPMDLAGGSRKSLRKAVNRVARNGYTAELAEVAGLSAATLAELEQVSERWRDGAAERGFSMTHDTVADALLPDALVVLARDEAGIVRGFLHFVPIFGRPAVSLGFMRRELDTPNGVIDFLVVEAARLLGERGIEEFSLNFAAFGRWLRDPANLAERLLARVLIVGDRWFQVERLLRFTQKFEPRWQPRYLLFEKPSALPRTALAAMWAEGQLPKPALPARRPQLALTPA